MSDDRLSFRGETLGAILPFVVFLGGVAWLGISGAPDERGFWAVLVVALAAGLLLARDGAAYAEAAIRGMSRRIVVLMLLAWMLAGILATVLGACGFVEALVWLADVSGVSGGLFCATAFLICCAVSTATGTSLGTILVCSPLIYPAGGALGAEPAVLLGSILGGATFGDNVSPVSDTTIASAGTQDAEMGRVVRSRMRYALPAAALALLGYAWAGGREATSTASARLDGDPVGWVLLVAPALVIVLLVRRRHLVEGLFYGIIAAAAIGLALGRINPASLIHVDPEQFGARGLIVDGIERAVGVSIFTLLLTALVAGLEASGLLERLTGFAAARARSVRGAELWLFAVVSAAVLLTTHSVVAILITAGFASSLGRRFGIDRYRRANLLDVTVCTYPFLLPYCIPTILAASTTQGAGDHEMPQLSAFSAGMWNLHSWMLLVVILVAVLTGWGRKR